VVPAHNIPLTIWLPYALRQVAVETSGTVTFIKTVGREPPEERVPHPAATRLAAGVKEAAGMVAARTLVFNVNAELTLMTAMSLAMVLAL